MKFVFYICLTSTHLQLVWHLTLTIFIPALQLYISRSLNFLSYSLCMPFLKPQTAIKSLIDIQHFEELINGSFECYNMNNYLEKLQSICMNFIL